MPDTRNAQENGKAPRFKVKTGEKATEDRQCVVLPVADCPHQSHHPLTFSRALPYNSQKKKKEWSTNI